MVCNGKEESSLVLFLYLIINKSVKDIRSRNSLTNSYDMRCFILFTLIINSYDKNLDLKEIAPENLHEMIVLTTPKLNNSHMFKYYEEIPDMSENEYLESRVLELHKIYNIHTIIAHDEYDLIRVGRIRDRLGIAGQSEKSGVSFRNKVIMKEHAKNSVATPKYIQIQSIFDVYDFAEEHGYPLIIKPIDQGASRGLTIIHNEEDIKEYSKKSQQYSMEVETFIDGDMYHIDSLFRNGNEVLTSVSKYWNGCIAFTNNSSLGSFQLHSESKEAIEVKEFLKQLLLSFECPENAVYHCEVFRDREGKLIFCEIASRYGGGYILQAVQETYGINLKNAWFRGQMGLEQKDVPREEQKLHGFLLVPPIKGKLTGIPESIPFDWVKVYQKSEVGTDFNSPARSIDKVAGLMIEGESSDILVERLNSLDAWFRSQLSWSNEGEPAH